jgi:hypothetical protein
VDSPKNVTLLIGLEGSGPLGLAAVAVSVVCFRHNDVLGVYDL